MKRFVSLILVLLLGFSLFSGSAFAEDASSDDTFTIYIYDNAAFCENMAESFEKCYLDQDTKQSLIKANWHKTDEMLRREIAAFFQEHARLKAEIEALLPSEIADCFHKYHKLEPSEIDSQVLRPFIEDNLETYNKTVETMLKLDGEMVDCYLELYYRGINTKEQIIDSIEKLSSESGATAAAGTLGIQLAVDDSYQNPNAIPQTMPTSTQKMSPLPTPSNETNVKSFVLMDGEVGDYGVEVVINEGTEFEEHEIIYYIPAGTYLVANLNEKGSGQVSVYCGGPEKNGEWEEFVADDNCAKPIVVEAGETKELEIKDGQFIVLSDNTSNFKFSLK